jgi:hypothetical protein
MSYDLQILRDNPIGYWSLSNTNKDITKYANTATVSGTYIQPPIIANSGYCLKVTNSTTVNIPNTSGKYQAFSKYYEYDTFTISFWFSLNNQLNGSGAGTYTNSQLNLLSIKNGSTLIGKIVYDYKSNTIRYTFPGTGNTDAYIVLQDPDRQQYVTATYSKGGISLNVNAKNGYGGQVSDKSIMSSVNNNSLIFVVADSSISSGKSFLISNIAFYDYHLSDEQLQRHILWAANDEKPNYQATLSASTSLFGFFDDPQLTGFSSTISNLDFSNNGKSDKLRVRQNGISALQLDTPTFNTSLDLTSTYTINSSSGINWSGSAGVDISFLPTYFNMDSGFTIYFTVNRTSTGSYNEYLMGISNVNGQSLYLEYDVPDGKTNYHLRSYDPYTGSITNLIDLSSGQAYSTAKVSNIALQFTSSAVTLYTSDNSGVSASYLPTAQLVMDGNSLLNVGNNYYAAKSLSSYINNFGITDDQTISTISATPFGSLSVFLMPLTDSSNPFLVKQRGTWIYQIPSVTVPMSTYYGTSFDWSTMDNCKVYYSIDSGSTYNLINRYETASLYNTLTVPQNISIKIQIDTDYVQDVDFQSFNNFHYNIYDALNIYSDGDLYTITASTSSVSPNVTLSNGTNNILARQKNFGLKFTGASATNVLITTPASVSYYAVEFWYRPDYIISGSKNYILNSTTSSVASPALWIEPASTTFYYPSGTLYINGVAQVPGAVTATVNDIYHLVLVLSASNNSNLYLNGGNLGASSTTSNGTYGYVQLWNNTPLSTDILDRYLQFTGKTIYPITDTNTQKLYSTSASDKYIITSIG